MISLNNISKSFNDKIIFSNLNIKIKSNVVTCIMGKSGIGKTTLLNMIMGFITPDSGNIDGNNKPISIVFSEDRLIHNISGFANIKFAIGNKIDDDIIIKILEEMELKEFINKPIFKYSDGMKRRVAIARGLLFPSNILLMDEPFKGLDNTTKELVLGIVEKHISNRTVLIITHDKTVADYFNSEIINL